MQSSSWNRMRPPDIDMRTLSLSPSPSLSTSPVMSPSSSSSRSSNCIFSSSSSSCPFICLMLLLGMPFTIGIKMSDDGILCRTESQVSLPYSAYALETCAKCYKYMPDWAFKPTHKFLFSPPAILFDVKNQRIVWSNETTILVDTFSSAAMAIKWQKCCSDALSCCLNHLNRSRPPKQNQLTVTFPTSSSTSSLSSAEIPSVHSIDVNGHNPSSPLSCPRTWDGWTCWDTDVPVGETVEKVCPDHIYWKITVPPCRGYVTKTCTPDGTWYSIEGHEWSNYTNCARDDIFLRRLRYSIVTHFMSVSFIIPALIIFNCYRQLSNTPRIRLHKHLFASLLLYSILSALMKLNLLFQKSDPESGSTTPSTLSSSSMDSYCLIVSVLLRYFRSSTYLCMFNEAFYLYQLIKRAFTAPNVTPLICVAYIVPLVMTVGYILARALMTPTESSWSPTGSVITITSPPPIDPCWMLPATASWKEWIINGPNLCMLMINSLLIFPIVKEIYKKANSMPSMSPAPYRTQPPAPSVAAVNPSSPGGGIVSNGASQPQIQKTWTQRRSLFTRNSRSPTGANNEPEIERNQLIKQNTMTTSSISKASLLVSLRAATLLLPLYGLHYLVIVYRPDVDVCWLSELYHYLSLTLDGLQGCLVSILFCFGNHEVRLLLKRTLFSKRGDGTLYMTEVVPVPNVHPT